MMSYLLLASHHGVDGDFAVEAGAGNDAGIFRTPGDLEAPLGRGVQLADDFAAGKVAVRVPAQNFAVLAAGEEQIRVLETTLSWMSRKVFLRCPSI